MNAQDLNSLEQLDRLLADGKVSEEDYETLRSAMEKKETEETRSETAPVRPRLRRSMKNRQLGGVCAGIAEHLGVDPNLVRIGTVILFLLTGGVAVIAYIILLFVLPMDTKKREVSTRIVSLMLVGLWVTHTAFLLYVAPRFLKSIYDPGAPYSESMMFAEILHDLFTPLPSLVVQAGALGLLLLVYAKLPKGSSARTVIRVGALTLFALLMVFYVVALGLG